MCIVDHIVTAAAPSLAATYCWIEFLIIVQVDLTQVKNRPGGVTSDTTGNTAVLLCCLLVAFPQGYWPNMIFSTIVLITSWKITCLGVAAMNVFDDAFMLWSNEVMNVAFGRDMASTTSMSLSK